MSKVLDIIFEEIDTLHKSVCFGVHTHNLKLAIIVKIVMAEESGDVTIDDIVKITFEMIHKFHIRNCMHWHTTKLKNRILKRIGKQYRI